MPKIRTEPRPQSNTVKREPAQTIGRPFQKGNPGRKEGSRNRLGESFLADLLNAWEQHGKQSLSSMIEKQPAQFVQVVAGLLPKHIEAKVERVDPESLSDAELAAYLAVDGGRDAATAPLDPSQLN